MPRFRLIERLIERRGIRAAAIALVLTTCPANAALLAGDAERSLRAVEELRDALADAETQSGAPRIANPELVQLFDAALPAAALDGAAPAGGEIELLLGASRRAQSLAQEYLLIGVGSEAIATQQGRERAARNFIVFLPEIARIYDFRVGVHARLSLGAASMHAAMAPGLREDPRIVRGFGVIVSETRSVIDATLAAGADVNIDPAWRIARLSVLLRAAPAFAALFDVKTGQAIADRALALAISENDATVALLMKNFALAILR